MSANAAARSHPPIRASTAASKLERAKKHAADAATPAKPTAAKSAVKPPDEILTYVKCVVRKRLLIAVWTSVLPRDKPPKYVSADATTPRPSAVWTAVKMQDNHQKRVNGAAIWPPNQRHVDLPAKLRVAQQNSATDVANGWSRGSVLESAFGQVAMRQLVRNRVPPRHLIH